MQPQKVFYSHMYAWTMLTEFNCQSATYMEILLYSIIFTQYFIIFSMLAMSACSFCFAHFCYTEVALSELLKEPHQPILNFRKRSSLLEYTFAIKLHRPFSLDLILMVLIQPHHLKTHGTSPA